MHILNILITSALVLIGMSFVYWLIEQLATWISPMLTKSNDRKIEKEIKKMGEDALREIRAKYPTK
jgi:serine protease inhibitor ecotin